MSDEIHLEDPSFRVLSDGRHGCPLESCNEDARSLLDRWRIHHCMSDTAAAVRHDRDPQSRHHRCLGKSDGGSSTDSEQAESSRGDSAMLGLLCSNSRAESCLLVRTQRGNSQRIRPLGFHKEPVGGTNRTMLRRSEREREQEVPSRNPDMPSSHSKIRIDFLTRNRPTVDYPGEACHGAPIGMNRNRSIEKADNRHKSRTDYSHSGWLAEFGPGQYRKSASGLLQKDKSRMRIS